MIRLYCESPLQQHAIIALEKGQSHYLANVMRAKLGQTLALFNHMHGEWEAEIITISKRQVELRLANQLKAPHAEPSIRLCFAPVKNAPQHFLIQKATELGVSELQPIITQRTIVSRINSDKLKANAIEASEQCGRLSVPIICEPVSFKQFIASLEPHTQLVYCDETGGGDTAITTLSSLPTDCSPSLLIGPEGGFSPEELTQLRHITSAKAIGLGPRILRADTAALAALTLLQATLGDWEKPPAFKQPLQSE